MEDVRMECLDALLRLSIDVRRHIEVVANAHGLTPPMARTIVLLEEPMRMSVLAEAAGCEPSHITGVAHDLEGQGLAHRIVDPDDHRARRLALTPKGRALRRRLQPAMQADAPVLSRIDDAEAATLLELIRPDAGDHTD